MPLAPPLRPNSGSSGATWIKWWMDSQTGGWSFKQRKFQQENTGIFCDITFGDSEKSDASSFGASNLNITGRTYLRNLSISQMHYFSAVTPPNCSTSSITNPLYLRTNIVTRGCQEVHFRTFSYHLPSFRQAIRPAHSPFNFTTLCLTSLTSVIARIRTVGLI